MRTYLDWNLSKFIWLSWAGEINLSLIFLWELTHSARKYFEKLAFKKNKEQKFKRLYLKSSGEFRVETNMFRKFIQFSSKERCFLRALVTLVHRRGICPLKPPLPLPAACRAQRVKFNICEKYLTCQHYIHVCSFYTRKAKLITLLNNY